MYGYGTKEPRAQCTGMYTKPRKTELNVWIRTEEHRAQCMVRNQGPQSSMYVYETDDHKV